MTRESVTQLTHAVSACQQSRLREDRWLVHHLAADLPVAEVIRFVQDARATPVVFSAASEATQTAILAGTRWLTGCHDRVMADATRLRAILELVEESLDEPDIDGAELASRAYLSRYHFDRLVHAALGEPPGAFRRRLLLERAAYRLATAADKVIEIALEAGYASPDAFARAFARAYGAPPSEFRRGRRLDYHLAAGNKIHFHPPGGLRLPAEDRSSTMDVLTGMYEHHIRLSGEILDRLDRLDDAALDRRIELSVEHIDAEPSLRRLADRLIRQLEMWATAIEGGTQIPAGATTVAALRERLTAAEPRFRAAVVAPVQDGRAQETFIDATCLPPQAFSLGGVLAHVLTFSAVRRTLAVGALASTGITDLGAGDPMSYVGGAGQDASTITRNFE